MEKMASELDPVSISTVKVWRGEPTDTFTKYSVRMLLIDTGRGSMPYLLDHTVSDQLHHTAASMAGLHATRGDP